MARLIMKPTLSLIVLSFFFISIISTFPTITDAKKQSSYAKTLNPKTLGMKKEKLTHFRVYWQDVASGPNATLTQITKAANGSSTFFGATFMMDDALTVGPELNSTLVGRAQGLYASSGQKQIGLTMAMNFLFLEGEYNGSTISIFGRNKVFGVREMPIVGGSGLFRFARGYVEGRTYTANFTTGDATVEYNVYVLHY